jgi:hypothetical protein
MKNILVIILFAIPLTSIAQISSIAEKKNGSILEPTKFKILETSKAKRFFPVATDSNYLFVSIDSSFSEELDKKIKKYSDSGESDIEAFTMEGEILPKVFGEMQFSPDDNLYYFLFNGDIKEIKLKDISKLVNNNNNIGIILRAKAKDEQVTFDTALGFAYVGKENPFKSSESKIPIWSKSEISVVPSDAYFQKKVYEFKSFKVGNVEVVRAYSKSPEKEKYDAHGFFLNDSEGIKELVPFFQSTEGRHFPHSIELGNWIKGYDGSLYIGPAGEYECGNFILFKEGSLPVSIPVNCGGWGC